MLLDLEKCGEQSTILNGNPLPNRCWLYNPWNKAFRKHEGLLFIKQFYVLMTNTEKLLENLEELRTLLVSSILPCYHYISTHSNTLCHLTLYHTIPTFNDLEKEAF